MRKWHPLANAFHDELDQLQDKYLEKLEKLGDPDASHAKHQEWHDIQNGLLSVLISAATRALHQAGVPLSVALQTVKDGYAHESAHDAVVCLDCERDKRK